MNLYSYLYDKLNRLANGTSDEGFNELISYDKMGNITSLNRNPVGTSSYSYDANGNQVSDSHKGITLAYNYLNLPETISKASTWETMTNVWLATGTKITKIVDDMTREYVGGIEYNSGMIEFIRTEEGRATMTSNATYSYEYMLKDHLGNTRVLLEEDGTVLETSDYYPFGLQVARGQTVTSPENRYKYNGKELQTELGLMQYDYGARFYDPVIGRWNVVDPLAEQYHSSTPYNYVDNNPIIKVDPNGMSPHTHMDTHGNILPLYDEGYLNVHATTEKEIQELLNQLQTDYPMSDSDQEDPKKEKTESVVNGQSAPLGEIGTGLGLLAEGSLSFEKKYTNNLFNQGYRRGINGNYQLTGRNLSLFGSQTVTSGTRPFTGWSIIIIYTTTI